MLIPAPSNLYPLVVPWCTSTRNSWMLVHGSIVPTSDPAKPPKNDLA